MAPNSGRKASQSTGQRDADELNRRQIDAGNHRNTLGRARGALRGPRSHLACSGVRRSGHVDDKSRGVAQAEGGHEGPQVSTTRDMGTMVGNGSPSAHRVPI